MSTEKSTTKDVETGLNSDSQVDQVGSVSDEQLLSEGTQGDKAGFEVPRPSLTLREAAAILGKSLRSLERSILGKWGNKLPNGWSARKVTTEAGQEWRIVPPQGFRLRQFFPDLGDAKEQNEISPVASLDAKRRLPWFADGQSLDNPTIVIDRSDEVESLLRELLQVQRQLSEERRLRMEDMRLITQMQGSMRLLETNASETARLKDDLQSARKEFLQLKDQYLAIVNAPWWKRLFHR